MEDVVTGFDNYISKDYNTFIRCMHITQVQINGLCGLIAYGN